MSALRDADVADQLHAARASRQRVRVLCEIGFRRAVNFQDVDGGSQAGWMARRAITALVGPATRLVVADSPSNWQCSNVGIVPIKIIQTA